SLLILGLSLLICCSCAARGAGLQATAKSDDHNTAVTFVVRFKKAVKSWNLDFIGKHLAYPVPAYILGMHRGKLYSPIIATSKKGYLTWMTPYLYELIENTPPQELVDLLHIKKGPSGKYLIHNLQYTANPNDHKYSKYAI